MKNPEHILITGASSGIGEALALHYAAQGVRLYITGRNQERLEAVGTQCEAQGAEVVSQLVDVVDKQAMASWMDGLERLDLVIANAGISGGTAGRKEGEPVEEARTIFDVNVHGVFNTVEPALKKMQSAMPAQGQIAIMSSLAGFRGYPSAPAYSASKGAVRFYGEALRGSLKDSGIEVNVICPGFVTSRMTDINDFPMPFKMSAEKASRIIAKGLAKNKGRICFPFPIHFSSWLVSILPDFLVQRMMVIVPDKVPAVK